jgi:hypothetical protein
MVQLLSELTDFTTDQVGNPLAPPHRTTSAGRLLWSDRRPRSIFHHASGGWRGAFVRQVALERCLLPLQMTKHTTAMFE